MHRLFAQTSALLLLLCLYAAGLQAQVQSEANALSRLDTLLSDIDTLSSDVIQLIVESDGGVLEESEIKMLLKQPDGFYWETINPFPELIVTDGKTLWNYQPDLEQVVVEDWDSSRSELAAQLLSGNIDSLSSDYSIESLAEGDSEHQEFELIPLESDSVYQRITINFMGGELESIYLSSRNGQQTVWQFENVIRNQAIADSRFEFTPPAGIEIIRNDYSQ